MDLNDLRRKRKAAADKMKAAATSLGELEAVADTSEECLLAAQAAFDEAQAEFNAVDKTVKREEGVEAALGAAAVSEIDDAPVVALAPAQAISPELEGADFGLMVASLAQSRGDPERAATRLEAAGHSGIAAALSGATEAAGGVTVPRAMSNTLIGLLKPRITVRRMGARVHDMPAGELRNARIASGPTAGYRGENTPIVESGVTFDKVDEKFKTLSSLVPVGNALLRHSTASVGQVVRDLMVDAMGLKADLAFLRYDGSGELPKGLRHWALAGRWQAGVGGSVSVVEAALRKCYSDVEDSNVQMVSPGWVMRASTKNFLASLKDPNSGAKLYPSIDNSGELHGFPIATTSQIPNNLGVGGDETEITFCDFAEIMIGESLDLVVGTSTEAAYVNTSGDTVSAYQNDLTLMRAIQEHDLAPMHDEAISGISGVGWGL